MKKTKKNAMARVWLLFLFCLFCLCCLLLLQRPAAASNEITHYTLNNPDVCMAIKKGLIDGEPTGSLELDRSPTRAEMVKMLLAALGYKEIPHYTAFAFQDLDNHWSRDLVQLVWELGLVKGDGSGCFAPDRPVSSKEAILLFDRARMLLGIPAERQTQNSGAKSDAGRLSVYTRLNAVADLLALLEESGQKYDVFGTVVDLNFEQREIQLRIGDVSQYFQLAPEVVLEKDHAFMPFDKWLVNHSVYVLLNDKGQITYIEVARSRELPLKIVEDAKINLTLKDNQSENDQNAQNNGVQVVPVDDPEQTEAEGMTIKALEGNFPLGEPRPLAAPDRQPALSLQVTRREINQPAFTALTGADGQGQVIAIIDSGVDPGHPDLQFTTSGERKIVQFIDITDEGYVPTRGRAMVENGVIKIHNDAYKIDLDNAYSDVLYYGYVMENHSRADDVSGIDFNLDGDQNDAFLAVVVARRSTGSYYTVIIDTDGDRDLTDEQPLISFNAGGTYASFSSNRPEKKFNFVVTEIDREGRWFKIGFDANDHGTHVAGIAAANGQIQGVAPGARIMVIKAVPANGRAKLSAVTKAMWYAGENGADIVSLSLGMYTIKKDTVSDLAQTVNEITAQHGTIFTIAVGNRGPGLGTVATPADADAAISVGAYISPRMWRTDYGWETVQDSVWFFSSMGPRYDGYSVPYVVAPGSAISTVPLWKGRPYGLLEGTSMAAPHVAGGVALLLDAAERAGKKVTPPQIKSALGQGARELPNLEPVEQGHGVIDLAKSWDCLNLPPATDKIDYSIHLLNNPDGKSIYERGLLPGRLTMTVSNHTDTNIPIQWKTDEDWLATNLAQSAVSANSSRKVELKLDHLEQPGLYSGYLFGENAATGNREIEFLTTVIVPHKLDKSNDCTFRTSETLGAGQFKRYYFVVPPGTAKLKATLSVPQDDDGNYLGRARLHIIDPAGNQKIMTDYAGFGPPDTVIRNQIGAEINQPKAGIWEVVVYSSATLSLYGKTESQYYFVCNLVGAGESGAAPPRSKSEDKNEEKRDWYVSVVPREIIPGEPTTFTLQVRDKSTNLPVAGFAVINDRLYELNQGKAEFRIVPDRDKTKIRVSVLRENL
ncbi:MAG: S8 family serine peptidase [Firmicutes bacterium]|nr:S8 family serine peptidase [Bacillota bacterium]